MKLIITALLLILSNYAAFISILPALNNYIRYSTLLLFSFSLIRGRFKLSLVGTTELRKPGTAELDVP